MSETSAGERDRAFAWRLLAKALVVLAIGLASGAVYGDARIGAALGAAAAAGALSPPYRRRSRPR